jgi:hypothetical protein
MIEAAPPAAATLPTMPERRRRTGLRLSGGIELEIDGVVVRVGIGHQRQDHRGGDTGAEGRFMIRPPGAIR